MAKRVSAAKDLFANGCNCSQAVFTAFCTDWGLEERLAMKIAGGIGGGFQRGEVCGAAAGACLVIGLACGHQKPTDIEQKKICGEKIAHFLNEFQKAFNSVLCRDLLGYDPRDQKARERFAEKNKEICPRAIETAATLLVEMGF